MSLKQDVYRELEDIVGTENISEDLAVLEGYAFQPWGGAEKGIRYFERPEAVVLPGSTREVQAIIKVCNRSGLQSKAFCTGFGSHNAADKEGVILLDLRRMNRILDIDEKNMYIVVEPYVSFAQVQAEAMKRGLCCHVIAAGSQTSFLASHTSMHGNNILSISHGYSGRNLFGFEWVLPTGEIVNIGSPGSGAGWFSGDGPGPSLRGIARGALGAMGGLGVFTKCAGHLHPWPGPTEINVTGISPYYEAEIPPYFEYHICEFPTWEQYGEAIYKIGEAGIAYALHKTGGPGSHGACVTGSNNEYYEKRQAGELAVPRRSFAIIMAGNTSDEHQYQVKVLDKILEETGGKISPVGEEPTFKNRDFLTMIKACFIPRLAFRLTGTFQVDGMLGMETMDAAALGLKVNEGHRDKYAKMGVIMEDGTLNSWGIAYEGTHFALFECGQQYSSINADSIRGRAEMEREGFEICYKTPFSFSWVARGEEFLKRIGPTCCNFHDWMRQIKKTFDPNCVSDPMNYIPAEESK
jgi:glycolate oxidase